MSGLILNYTKDRSKAFFSRRPYNPDTKELMIGHDAHGKEVWRRLLLNVHENTASRAHPERYQQFPNGEASINDLRFIPEIEALFDKSLTDPLEIEADKVNTIYDNMLKTGHIRPLDHAQQLADELTVKEFGVRKFAEEQLED